ncbi:MAG: HAD-IIA family hydrolase [Anaerolineaceae bacterium]|jgi:4-nitrophenyl phosphatase
MITDHFTKVKGLIIDMDGVLWHDNEPLGDLPGIFAKIRSLGLDFVLATNNSSKTVSEFQEKLKGFGLQIDSSRIVTSALATFQYLKESYPENKVVYIIGSDSFRDDARSKGFSVLLDGEQKQADFVIVGLDFKLTYEKISYAARQIIHGAKFIATNTDATFPTPTGVIPGAGTMVAAVQTASGEEPLVIGKPAIGLYDQAMKVMGLSPDQVLCIGDRLSTDILGAKNSGFASAFVLSGINSLEDLEQWESKPDIIVDDLTALIYG